MGDTAEPLHLNGIIVSYCTADKISVLTLAKCRQFGFCHFFSSPVHWVLYCKNGGERIRLEWAVCLSSALCLSVLPHQPNYSCRASASAIILQMESTVLSSAGFPRCTELVVAEVAAPFLRPQSHCGFEDGVHQWGPCPLRSQIKEARRQRLCCPHMSVDAGSAAQGHPGRLEGMRQQDTGH